MFSGIRTVINTIRGSLSGASRSHYRSRGLDASRAEGERPYEDLDDGVVKLRYVEFTARVRESDGGDMEFSPYGERPWKGGGMQLSPYVDKAWNLREEWKERGNDPAELRAALREAGYEADEVTE